MQVLCMCFTPLSAYMVTHYMFAQNSVVVERMARQYLSLHVFNALFILDHSRFVEGLLR